MDIATTTWMFNLGGNGGGGGWLVVICFCWLVVVDGAFVCWLFLDWTTTFNSRFALSHLLLCLSCLTYSLSTALVFFLLLLWKKGKRNSSSSGSDSQQASGCSGHHQHTLDSYRFDSTRLDYTIAINATRVSFFFFIFSKCPFCNFVWWILKPVSLPNLISTCVCEWREEEGRAGQSKETGERLCLF